MKSVKAITQEFAQSNNLLRLLRSVYEKREGEYENWRSFHHSNPRNYEFHLAPFSNQLRVAVGPGPHDLSSQNWNHSVHHGLHSWDACHLDSMTILHFPSLQLNEKELMKMPTPGGLR